MFYLVAAEYTNGTEDLFRGVFRILAGTSETEETIKPVLESAVRKTGATNFRIVEVQSIYRIPNGEEGQE
jgi:hypothetical protein